MLDPFGGQCLSLAREPAAILLFWRRHPDHCADTRLATFVRQQGSNQCLSVDPVGFRSSASTRCCDRGGIDNVTLDTFALQHSMNPEPVQSRFLDNDDRNKPSRPPFGLSLSCERRVSSPLISPPETACFDIFSPLPGESDVISNVERLSYSQTKIAPRSAWMAVR